jgi:heptosyltransferase-2
VEPILVIKTGALGDVLRTTSILPGLRARTAAPVVWLTATGAADLVRLHPLVDELVTVDPRDEAAVAALGEELSQRRFSWVVSLDDERPLCALASAMDTARLSGAHLDERGERAYTRDVGPWFDMGLLSIHGKAEADRRKLANERSHAAIYADMLGIEMGEPELPLPPESQAFGARFAERHELASARPVIGLNTGSGGRWVSKQLSVERTVELASELARALEGRATFVLFGGPEERERNAAILAGLRAAGLRHADAGTENSLLDFAALVSLCDLLVASDSLALHVAVARRVPVVCFFAPTSASEIELYGRGEKVRSTAADYCSYRRDADNATVTPERLAAACLRVLGGAPSGAHGDATR